MDQATLPARAQPPEQAVYGASAAAAGEDASVASRTDFISFAIGDGQYGVDIMAVREIKGWVDITHLPKQPEYVRGVLNLRGSIVPIVDLRCRLGQGLTEPTPLHIVIIVQIGAHQIGLIGDRVLDIVSVETANIQPVPRAGHVAVSDFLLGLAILEDTMIALIDIPSLLSERLAGEIENAAVDPS